MGRAVHRPWYRTGVNEKHEDEWWLTERKRDDTATAPDMAPFDASLCLDESCHDGSHEESLTVPESKISTFQSPGKPFLNC